MTKVLVDSSIWISWFKDRSAHPRLAQLIVENQICTNELILAELIPYLKFKKQDEIIEGLLNVEIVPLDINWETIITFQLLNLGNRINKVGIPDLIILQNAVDKNLPLFTEDKHFKLMQRHTNVVLY